MLPCSHVYVNPGNYHTILSNRRTRELLVRLPDIPYGTFSFSPISQEEFKQTVLFSEETRYLRMAILAEADDANPDSWYNECWPYPISFSILANHDKEPDSAYLGAVPSTLQAKWILHCNREYDQAWLTTKLVCAIYLTKKNQTEPQVQSVPMICYGAQLLLSIRVTAPLRTLSQPRAMISKLSKNASSLSVCPSGNAVELP